MSGEDGQQNITKGIMDNISIYFMVSKGREVTNLMYTGNPAAEE